MSLATLKLTKSTILHLRFPFSILLAPVFFFAMSQSVVQNSSYILLVFLILHLLIYPASNGYNSYYDRDEESIGGLSAPPKVTEDLLLWSWLLEAFGLIGAAMIDLQFALMLFVYGVFSKLYSHPRTRFKARPILSWLVVVFFQGAWIYLATALVLDATFDFAKHWMPALISSALLAGAYPISQIFQHREDAKRGDRTLSLVLGIRGTFVFSSVCLLVASASLIFYFFTKGAYSAAIATPLFLLPAGVFFVVWVWNSHRDSTQASFRNTMRMNIIWALCAILLFLFVSARSAVALEANLFELDNRGGEIVFRFRSKDVEGPTGKTREIVFENAAGETVASEKLVYSAFEVREYRLDHLQQKTTVKIERMGEKYEAEIEREGKKSKSSVSSDSELIFPPLIVDRIRADLPSLAKGGELKFKVLIPDLMQTITFRARMDKKGNEGQWRVRLEPANWLISLLAPPPLYFVYSKETSQILEAEGQTLLLNSKGKPFFARTVFRVD